MAITAADPGSAARPCGSDAGVRRGFTLIEMLVVIGIVMLLMGIGVVSLIRQPKLNSMVAAEQAVADALRQARHTAQTTGQPVVLRLKAGERAITGLVRRPLWHGTEGWPRISDLATPPNQVDQPGRTGTGLALPEAFCKEGALANGYDDTAGAANRMLLPGMGGIGGESGQPLTGTARLWRGSAEQRPPLMLSVAVIPPLAGDYGSADFLPLVPLAMVGPDAEPDVAPTSTFASYDQSCIGLFLINTRLPTGAGGSTGTAATPSWEILGWFGTGASRVEVSSITNPPPDLAATSGRQTNLVLVQQMAVDRSVTPIVKGDAESWPLTGGRWTEISLLLDGDRLILYRDGRRVGESAGAGATVISEPAAERIYVGIAKVPSILPGGIAPAQPIGGLQSAAGARLDDVRLERLGDTVVGNLPSGVFVGPTGNGDASRRIVCHPDGRVDVLWEAVTGHPAAPVQPQPILLTSADGGVGAQIEIDANGTVRRSSTQAGAGP